MNTIGPSIKCGEVDACPRLCHR